MSIFYNCTNTYQKKMYTFDKCAKLCLTEYSNTRHIFYLLKNFKAVG